MTPEELAAALEQEKAAIAQLEAMPDVAGTPTVAAPELSWFQRMQQMADMPPTSIGGVTPTEYAQSWTPSGIANQLRIIPEEAASIGGSILGGSLGAALGGPVGAVAGGALGAAAAKLSSIKSGVPKPKIPKPPSQPRIKTVKIKKPKDYTGDINVPSSADFQKEAMSLPNVGTEQLSNINQNLSGLV